MKLLWYGESSYVETGAGQVAKHLLSVFKQTFDQIVHVAINQHWGVPALPNYYQVIANDGRDAWNKQNFRDALKSLDYDAVFVTADLNVITEFAPEISHARSQGKKIIMYAAMDTMIYTRSFWEVLTLADIPVVFTHWCKRQAVLCVPELATNLWVVYHGCEPDVFYPLPEDERLAAREEMFGISDDCFLIVNVNRNQMRKDIARTIAAFSLFVEDIPHSLLYLHSKQHDLGGDLPSCARYFGLKINGDANVMFPPRDYNELVGISRADMNRIYNAADVVVSTSTGEGWGFSTTEAMAAGRPFIGPNNTVFPELLGEPTEGTNIVDVWETERGMLIESGGPDLWAIPYGISATPRELCSTTAMRDALAQVYYFRNSANERALAAREWTLQHTWGHVQAQWLNILMEVLP